MSEPVIEVRHLSKSFGTHVVLRDVDFTVNAGDVTCIIGASGSGKSTLLRCINLLETPTNGKVLFHGSDITAKGSDPCAYRAKVGMVFQSFNLFNNMTVLENCTGGLRYVLRRTKRPPERPPRGTWKRSAWPPASTPAAPAFRRPEAARCDCPRPGDSPKCCFSMSRPPPLTRKWSVRCWPSCASWPKRA